VSAEGIEPSTNLKLEEAPEVDSQVYLDIHMEKTAAVIKTSK
jgi:hypothetical protein